MTAVATDVTAHGSIKNGRILFRDRRQFDDQIRQFREGVEIEVSVTIRRATRSLSQNAYFWGVVIQMISEHTGYTPDEVHEFLKMKFIPKKLAICDGNGEVVDEYVLGGSTRKLDTEQFSRYCEDIRRWSAETLDLVIPDPDGGL